MIPSSECDGMKVRGRQWVTKDTDVHVYTLYYCTGFCYLVNSLDEADSSCWSVTAGSLFFSMILNEQGQCRHVNIFCNTVLYAVCKTIHSCCFFNVVYFKIKTVEWIKFWNERQSLWCQFYIRAVSGDWCRRDNLEEGLGMKRNYSKETPNLLLYRKLILNMLKFVLTGAKSEESECYYTCIHIQWEKF